MKKLNIYMIGIKGVGMTMLAQFLAKQGHRVMGSDISDSFMTDGVLQREKIVVLSPFNPKNIPDNIDLFIYSSAYSLANNSELRSVVSKQKGRLKSYAEALGEVFNNHKGIAVCGSHGKTTVSAWLGYVLLEGNKRVNVLVGAQVPQFKGNAIYSQSQLFVAEVDEYQNKLQYFNPQGVVLNNIDFDHPDYFSSKRSYFNVFRDFVKKIPKTGFLIINASDRKSNLVAKYCRAKIISYDIQDSLRSDRSVNYLAFDISRQGEYQTFQVNNFAYFRIRLWGRHNIYNALAVIASARELGVSLVKIKKYLEKFRGTERRMQILGKYKGALIIDDYAHHPTEIKASLEGLRKHYPDQNIITVFHPHTFSRTKTLFNDFLASFIQTNELIILDIYSSAREEKGNISSSKLLEGIKKYNKKKDYKQELHYIPELKQVAKYLKKKINKDDIVLLMGAGDVFRIGEYILDK